MQSIFRSAPRRETLGKHLKGGRRGGELKIDWTKPLLEAALNPEGVRTAGLSDEKINEYLAVVAKNPDFSRHREWKEEQKGKDITLPLKKDGDTIAVFYNNAEEKLPELRGGESMLNGTPSSDQIALETKGSSRKRVTGPCYGTPRVAPMATSRVVA
jgi:hypothetical protein